MPRNACSGREADLLARSSPHLRAPGRVSVISYGSSVRYDRYGARRFLGWKAHPARRAEESCRASISAGTASAAVVCSTIPANRFHAHTRAPSWRPFAQAWLRWASASRRVAPREGTRPWWRNGNALSRKRVMERQPTNGRPEAAVCGGRDVSKLPDYRPLTLK